MVGWSVVGWIVGLMIGVYRAPAVELVGKSVSFIAPGRLVRWIQRYISLQIRYKHHMVLQTPLNSGSFQLSHTTRP